MKKKLNLAAIACFLLVLALCVATVKIGHGVMTPFHGFSSGA